MSHWDVVWLCFGLTVAVLLIDFWQAHRAGQQVRARLLLSADSVPPEAGGTR